MTTAVSIHMVIAKWINGPPLKEFCPDAAIDLWWKDKLRRPHQHIRKDYAARTTSSEGDSTEVEGEEEMDMLKKLG